MTHPDPIRQFILDIVREMFPGEYHLCRLQYDALAEDARADRPPPAWRYLYASAEDEFRSPEIFSSFSSLPLIWGTEAALREAEEEQARAPAACDARLLALWESAMIRYGMDAEQAGTITARHGQHFLAHLRRIPE